MEKSKEEILRKIFRMGLFLKWIFASLQLIGGTILLFISQNIITRGIIAITREELTEDPRDYIATHILQFGTHLSLSTKLIIALYLIIHGIIKFYLLYGLWKDKLSAYPLSAGVFSLFLAYQLYRYSFTYSVWLLILSLFDLIYIYLIIHEYRLTKKTYKK
jgi:uncharacterized membrane protein